MFNDLTDKFEGIFKKLRGQGKLTEKNIRESMREVRRALLEADVNFRVAKDFIAKIQERAVGREVLSNIAPGQQVVKIVHDELVSLLGNTAQEINFSPAPPSVLMLVGLQGSGKTTTAGKLACKLRAQGKKPLLVAADIYRPAAVQQLKIIGKSMDIPVYHEDIQDAVRICKNGKKYAQEHGLDLCIFDTAGRQHVDETMMNEIGEIRNSVKPDEILFVADAMTGQDAVNAAKAFHERVDFSGVVLTKMDGDARGGAALSILAVTGKPVKFIGVSEKTDGLEKFHPDRMANRILGMGDIVSLVEKAQENVDIKEAEKLERKLRKNEFTFEDFLSQIKQIRKMGPMQDILAMIPGASKLKGVEMDDKAVSRTEAIIFSMTAKERRKPSLIDGSRRKRISRGSGTSVRDVNQLLKQFEQMQKMIKQMNKSPGKLSRMAGSFPF